MSLAAWRISTYWNFGKIILFVKNKCEYDLFINTLQLLRKSKKEAGKSERFEHNNRKQVQTGSDANLNNIDRRKQGATAGIHMCIWMAKLINKRWVYLF